MYLRSFVVVLFITMLMNSCVPKSIINDRSKYYWEHNVMKSTKEQLQLVQTVCTNDIKNGLHGKWSTLVITFSNTVSLKENQLVVIEKDTSLVKVTYEFNSNRFWDVSSKKISGTFKIKTLENDFITIDEDIKVLDDMDREVIFKGSRKFKNDSIKAYKMRKNKQLWFLRNRG